MSTSIRTSRDRNRALGRALVLASLAAIAAGCSTDKSDLEKFVRDERAKPGGAIEPLPTPRVFDTFTYKPEDRRSPFSIDLSGTALALVSHSRGGAVGADQVTIDKDRAHEYLEDYPLDSLRMVGTLTLKGTQYALVRDGDGTVHRVVAGNYLGQNNGKIVSISETEIHISEIVSDGRGSYVSRDTALSLNQ